MTDFNGMRRNGRWIPSYFMTLTTFGPLSSPTNRKLFITRPKFQSSDLSLLRDFVTYEPSESTYLNLHSFRSCTTLDGCISKVTDIIVHDDGKVEARLIFRYPAYCAINYYNYPEETNDCCLFLSMMETERNIEYTISARAKDKVNKQVAITDIQKEKDMTVLTNVETSAWNVMVCWKGVSRRNSVFIVKQMLFVSGPNSGCGKTFRLSSTIYSNLYSCKEGYEHPEGSFENPGDHCNLAYVGGSLIWGSSDSIIRQIDNSTFANNLLLIFVQHCTRKWFWRK